MIEGTDVLIFMVAAIERHSESIGVCTWYEIRGISNGFYPSIIASTAQSNG